MSPEIAGVTIQEPKIPAITDQWTAEASVVTRAKPMSEPMMVWVVETGQPKTEARMSQTPEAKRAEIMPSASLNSMPL